MATNSIFTCWLSSFIWSCFVRVSFFAQKTFTNQMIMHFSSHPFTLKCLIYYSLCMCLQIWYLEMKRIRFYKTIFYFFQGLLETTHCLLPIACNCTYHACKKKMRSIYSNVFSFCFFGIWFQSQKHWKRSLKNSIECTSFNLQCSNECYLRVRREKRTQFSHFSLSFFFFFRYSYRLRYKNRCNWTNCTCSLLFEFAVFAIIIGVN